MRTTLHLACLAGVSMLAMAAAPALAAEDAADDGLGTIVVTATKRAIALDQTPIAASAVSGKDLAAANAQSLSDYITRLPGVVFNDYQPGVSEVIIRGISATTYHEQGQTTVGYYLNEVPLVEPGFPIGIPDVDTFDLNRVRRRAHRSAARPARHAVRFVHAGRPGQLRGQHGRYEQDRCRRIGPDRFDQEFARRSELRSQGDGQRAADRRQAGGAPGCAAALRRGLSRQSRHRRSRQQRFPHAGPARLDRPDADQRDQDQLSLVMAGHLSRGPDLPRP